MTNPSQSNSCTHQWVCLGMDRNDALYRCTCCGLLGDGHGFAWTPRAAAQEAKS